VQIAEPLDWLKLRYGCAATPHTFSWSYRRPLTASHLVPSHRLLVVPFLVATMASVAGRKKSVISNTGLQIDTPIANNTLLNKSASQSTSLYQQCSSLRARLMRIHNFPDFFAIASPPESRHSTDPVTQLWDCFALGIPLCYIFNLLPPPVIPSRWIPPEHLWCLRSARKETRHRTLCHADQTVSQCEPFTVTDLGTVTRQMDWSRYVPFPYFSMSNSKMWLWQFQVINTVTVLVDRLPEDQFMDPPDSPPSMLSSQDSIDSLSTTFLIVPPTNAQETARNNIIRRWSKLSENTFRILKSCRSVRSG